jgi:hypothetical protein
VRRRAKDLQELRGDPRLTWHTGQLLGATIMVSHWMEIQDDPQVKAMGKRLGEATNWFFVGGPTPVEEDDVGAWPTEAETRVK